MESGRWFATLSSMRIRQLAITGAVFCGVTSSLAAAEDGPSPQPTPESAMLFLVQTLPGLKVLDTWNGGRLEAVYDRARAKNRCSITVGAPRAKIYTEFGGDRALRRQSWLIDFSKVTGVGQQGTRVIYKVYQSPKLNLGIVANSPAVASQMARSIDTLRRACEKNKP